MEILSSIRDVAICNGCVHMLVSLTVHYVIAASCNNVIMFTNKALIIAHTHGDEIKALFMTSKHTVMDKEGIYNVTSMICSPV